MSFSELDLASPLLRALSREGYKEPTQIQTAAIPQVLKNRDLLAIAQTGTGKTAAFALPLLQLLSGSQTRTQHGPRALVITPTRELALQIEDSFCRYGRFLPVSVAVIVGGVAINPQIAALRKRPEILVATPGRLLDLMRQGVVRLNQTEILVLDEADRMLDTGFLPDVRRIAASMPSSRQTMLFSATLPAAISAIAHDLLRNPAKVEVTPAASVSKNIEQKVLFVEREDKRALLANLLKDKSVTRALVFTRTKHRADRIARGLSSQGISAEAIHSNKSQGARQRALTAFHHGKVRVLVATDILSRGIDVEQISHVINYELPEDAESYVHRIGRTARAGAAGIALSLCDIEETPLLRAIEKLTTRCVTTMTEHPFHCQEAASLHESQSSPAATERKSGKKHVSRRPAARLRRRSTSRNMQRN